MRVLLQSRTTLFTVPGGDTVQIVATKQALERRGVRADISLDLEPSLTGYDLVHLFNIIRPQEVCLQARNARKQGRAIALSTIYVVYDEFERHARRGVYGLAARVLSAGQVEWGKVLARALFTGERHAGVSAVLRHGYVGLQRELAGFVDVLLPNSRSEAQRVQRVFAALRDTPVVIVPNGFDTARFSPCGVQPLPEIEGCVLSVGRIEGRKGQRELVDAVRGLDLRLVLVGKPAPHHMRYYEQVRREAGANVTFVGHVEHAELPRYYRSATVHVLPSWFETTGLSSLEAAAMGCSVVITDRGDQRDYFGDLAFYCEPGSVQSIRSALLRAYEAPVNPQLADHVRQHFTWERAADKTIEGYETALVHRRDADRRSGSRHADASLARTSD